ncbi:DUF1444 domain-containing protein [Bacillus salitolerans]|uniref:UPF0354 protein ACFSCX_22700 n=1 Tax=Bacillus salitolerans TaxID=1437434 RepID=A0ABW4LVT5_9BACI
MKMTSKKMRDILQARLQHPAWSLQYDTKKDTLRVFDTESKTGVTVSLPGIINKWEEQKDQAVDEVVYYIEESLKATKKNHQLEGKENKIYPVIRSTSFPMETKDGKKLLTDEHTAETRIYYAVDLGTTYKLIDEELLVAQAWSPERVKEIAKFNVRSLPIQVKQDVVADNVFYFFNTNDGYDASRILHEPLLEKYHKEKMGDLAVAVPHQDVLIIADIRNETGYDILAQMTMSFFTNGLVPITALSFLYEDGELEPIFILGKNKRKS